MWSAKRTKFIRRRAVTKLDMVLYGFVISVVVVGIIGIVVAINKDDKK